MTGSQRMRANTLITGMVLLVLLFTSFRHIKNVSRENLKHAFQDEFLVGAAINGYQIVGRDKLSAPVIDQQFNTLTTENWMKWERIHPKPDKYNFRFADRFVEMGLEKDMHLVGHTLIWHNQTPRWVFQNSDGEITSRDTLLMRMRTHIHTVVGRYKGKIKCWDVVNEAIDGDGEMRNSLWYQIIGDDYIEKAFTYAREADPEATLIYNDYSLPDPPKRNGVVKMVKDLQSKGVPIDGIGLQAHYNLKTPSVEDIEATIQAFAGLGLRVMITELDVTVLPDPGSRSGAEINQRFKNDSWLDPYTDGLPDSVQLALANRYRDLFVTFKSNSDHIDRVTFWGVHDGVSWKNNHPVRGRTNYPLLFDREAKPKPAFDAVLQVGTSD